MYQIIIEKGTIMENVLQLTSLILNFILGSGLVGTLIFLKPKKRKENAEAKSEELKNTEQVVEIQSQQIRRLDGRVEKLEDKVDKLTLIIEKKDVIIDQNRAMIRQADKCDRGADQCPVLILKAEIERRRKERIEKELKQEKEDEGCNHEA